jgi:hypothetical protein
MAPFVAFRAALLVLLMVAAAWFIRTARWRETRLLPFGLALLGGLALLTRRVGWSELLLIAALIVIPAILFAPTRR